MTNIFKKITLLTILCTIAPAHTKQISRPGTAPKVQPAPIQPMPTQPSIPVIPAPMQPAPVPVQPVIAQPIQVQPAPAYNTWTSSAGLVYRSDLNYTSGGTSSIIHILKHAKADPKKPKHSVFDVPEDKILDLVDEAWTRRGTPRKNPQGTGDEYIIDMGEVVGTKGETRIQINTRKGTSEVISAYPVK
jgi:hypothetical protein